MTEVERFLELVNKTDTCWLWTGHISVAGYGRFYFRGKSSQAHRVSLELFKNIHVPEGLDACHTCDVKKCVNPNHLFSGTRSENMKDCVSKNRHNPAYHNKRKTSCPKGHEYTEQNTWINSKGWRWCKECNRMKALKNYERSKDKAST